MERGDVVRFWAVQFVGHEDVVNLCPLGSI